MAADIARLKNVNGQYQTFYLDTPNNQRLVAKAESDFGRAAGNSKGAVCCGIIFGTAAFVGLAIIIGCAATGCYDSNLSDSERAGCQATCIDTEIPAGIAAALGLITSIGLCIAACVKK